jgi:hypothetical protein
MTGPPVLAEDVKTLKYITTIVSALWPAPISGAVHVGRRLDAQNNYGYRAIVTGFDSNRRLRRTLTELQVGNSRTEVLLRLLEAVEDITEGYFHKLDKESEAAEENEIQEEERENQGTAMQEGRPATEAGTRVVDWLATSSFTHGSQPSPL